ncbi:hypothetical protein PHYC_02220 [Phycisphaerales bacterium]|nr:hypothetical protein PHYC_02220 [Phycisphaerales bacterium]
MNRTTLALSLAALGLLMIGGCYKRTVSTRGIGSYGSGTQESYRSNTAADRWYDEAFTSKKTTRTKWVETNK